MVTGCVRSTVWCNLCPWVPLESPSPNIKRYPFNHEQIFKTFHRTDPWGLGHLRGLSKTLQPPGDVRIPIPRSCEAEGSQGSAVTQPWAQSGPFTYSHVLFLRSISAHLCSSDGNSLRVAALSDKIVPQFLLPPSISECWGEGPFPRQCTPREVRISSNYLQIPAEHLAHSRDLRNNYFIKQSSISLPFLEDY